MMKYFKWLPLYMALLYLLFFGFLGFASTSGEVDDFEGFGLWAMFCALPLSAVLLTGISILPIDTYVSYPLQFVAILISGMLEYALLGWGLVLLATVIKKRPLFEKKQAVNNKSTKPFLLTQIEPKLCVLLFPLFYAIVWLIYYSVAGIPDEAQRPPILLAVITFPFYTIFIGIISILCKYLMGGTSIAYPPVTLLISGLTEYAVLGWGVLFLIVRRQCRK